MTIDDLEDADVLRMDHEEITAFLTAHGAGVLGLPSDGAPYLLPLSYGYDGADALYFTYVLDGESRKEVLSDRADTSSFLVYTASSPFQWQSVLLEGHIEAVDPGAYDDLRETISDAWRPAVFEQAAADDDVAIYRFSITDRAGLKATGLPPGLRGDDESNDE